jgi:group I intron endonuclease
LNPPYNINKIAGGLPPGKLKHKDETKKLMSDIASARVWPPEIKSKIREAFQGENNHFYGKKHTEESKQKISKTKSRSPIYVYSENKVLLYIFTSTKLFAGLIKANVATINKAIDELSLFRGHWYIKREPINNNETPIIKENTIPPRDPRRAPKV